MDQQREHTKSDPSLYLDEDCMSYIFSFVGGTAKKDPRPRSKKRRKQRRKTARYELPGTGPYWSVKEAANLCHTLASVSPEWEGAVQESINSVISRPLDVNLGDFESEESARSRLSWLCQHKPCIGKLRSRLQWSSLTKELIELLQECDTSRLEQVELYLAWEQEQLQDVIAQQCPNLQALSIFVNAGETASLPGLLSPTLLSLSSLEELEICLISSKGVLSETDGMAMNQLVEGVPDITPLDEGTLQILSFRHPKELRFEPYADYAPKKYALTLATMSSFKSPTFEFRP